MTILHKIKLNKLLLFLFNQELRRNFLVPHQDYIFKMNVHNSIFLVRLKPTNTNSKAK